MKRVDLIRHGAFPIFPNLIELAEKNLWAEQLRLVGFQVCLQLIALLERGFHIAQRERPAFPHEAVQSVVVIPDLVPKIYAIVWLAAAVRWL